MVNPPRRQPSLPFTDLDEYYWVPWQSPDSSPAQSVNRPPRSRSPSPERSYSSSPKRSYFVTNPDINSPPRSPSPNLPCSSSPGPSHSSIDLTRRVPPPTTNPHQFYAVPQSSRSAPYIETVYSDTDSPPYFPSPNLSRSSSPGPSHLSIDLVPPFTTNPHQFYTVPQNSRSASYTETVYSDTDSPPRFPSPTRSRPSSPNPSYLFPPRPPHYDTFNARYPDIPAPTPPAERPQVSRPLVNPHSYYNVPRNSRSLSPSPSRSIIPNQYGLPPPNPPHHPAIAVPTPSAEHSEVTIPRVNSYGYHNVPRISRSLSPNPLRSGVPNPYGTSQLSPHSDTRYSARPVDTRYSARPVDTPSAGRSQESVPYNPAPAFAVSHHHPHQYSTKEILEQALTQALTRLKGSSSLDKSTAESWIEWLDYAICEVNATNHALAVRGIRRLQTMSRHFGYLPKAYLLNNVKLESDKSLSSSVLSDVYRACWGTRQIALKALRVHMDNRDEVSKAFHEEVIMWRSLRHPNIVPFLGVSDRFPLCLVSEWMPNGTISAFLRTHPEENRVKYIGDIINGLQYIHSYDIVHGDLKSANILVDGNGRVRLGDFGLTTVLCNTTTLSATVGGQSSRGTVRWMAPELLRGGDYQMPSLASDIYAFGLVCWELFTGKIPFDHIRQDYSVIIAIHRGDRPPKPGEFVSAIGFNDSIWEMMTQCWREDPSTRPSLASVLEIILDLQDARLDMIAGLIQHLGGNILQQIKDTDLEEFQTVSAMGYHARQRRYLSTRALGE